MHRADRMYLTRVHAEIEGDTFFPEFDDVSEWQLIDSEHFEADEKNEYPYSFLTVRPRGLAPGTRFRTRGRAPGSRRVSGVARSQRGWLPRPLRL